MGHTNSTANLALPQFIGTDKPTWLGDVNGAFSAIDSKVGTIDADIAATDAKADNAVADAANAVTTATNANNTAGTASTTATNALNVANNALTVANNADGHTNQLETKVGLLANLTTTDKTSIVNAINEVDANEGDLTNLTTSDKSSLVAAINEINQGGNASVSSVSVTADGVKTYSQLLNDLYALVDLSDIKGFVNLADEHENNTLTLAAPIVSNIYVTSVAVTSSNYLAFAMDIKANSSIYRKYTGGGSVSDESATVPTSGKKLTLYYI